MRATPFISAHTDSAMARAEENRLLREAKQENEAGETGETGGAEIPSQAVPPLYPAVHESLGNPARQERERSERLYGTGATESPAQPTARTAQPVAQNTPKDHGGPAIGYSTLPAGEFVERPRRLDSSGRPLEQNPRHVIGEFLKGIGAVTKNETVYAFVMGRLATGQYDRLADYIEDAVLGAPEGTLTDEERTRAERAASLARNTTEGSI